MSSLSWLSTTVPALVLQIMSATPLMACMVGGLAAAILFGAIDATPALYVTAKG